MSTRQLLSEMLQKGTLRALDKNVQDVCAITKDTDSSFSDLAEVIMRDAALSTNLLATANSVLYAGIEPVKTISAAVLRLGFDKIQALALGLSLFKQVGQNARTPDLYRMYASTYFAGSLARELLRRRGLFNPEEGFVSGLLSQVPRLLLANTFPLRYKEAERLIATEGIAFDEACGRVFGIEYQVIRKAVLDHWHLGDDTAAAPKKPEDEEEALIRESLVSEAANLADMLFGNLRGGETHVQEVEKRIGELLGAEEFSAAEVIRTTTERDENIHRFFKLTPKDIDMMVQIAQWGRVSAAQVAASLTLGSAQDELNEGGEAPDVAIGNYLTEMLALSRRSGDVNHLLLLAQEAAFRCLRPAHVFTALLDGSQSVLRGRFHAGSGEKLAPTDFSIEMARRDNPIVQSMIARVVWRGETKGPNWNFSLIRELKIRHAIMAPIIAQDRSLGIQFLGRTEDAAFSKQEQTWLEAITSVVSLVFERDRHR